MYFVFLFLISVKLIAIVDFEVQGTLYDVFEKNGDSLIKEKIAELNITKIRKEIKKQIFSIYTTHSHLSNSNKDNNFSRKDVVRSQYDVLDYMGNIIAKKGENIVSSIPFGMELHLCFIDGNYKKKIIEEIINTFGRECIYFVDNVDTRKFKILYNVLAYPLGGQNLVYIKRFKVDRLPTKVTKKEDFLYYQQIDINRIVRKYQGVPDGEQ